MRNKNRREDYLPLWRVSGLFGLAGGLLFAWVWWPIQAERNLVQLRKIETLVFQKKAELHLLNDRYDTLTSLTVLDQWAKKHGPWVPRNAENVIAIQ